MDGGPIAAQRFTPGETPAAPAGIPVTHRNYRYRLKLRACQHRALDAILEQQRLLYNGALQERIDVYRKTGRGVSYVDQCKSLTQIRGDKAPGIKIPRIVVVP